LSFEELYWRLAQAEQEGSDMGALATHAMTMLQEMIAAWEMVDIALRALNDPKRLRRVAWQIAANEDTHPAALFFEEFPEFVDLADTTTETVSHFRPDQD